MNDYCLVDCGFHDRLETLVILRQTCQIIYRNAGEEIVEVCTQIADIYAADKADFMKLADGTEIRLDHLISVNGRPISFVRE
jgi:Rho-binding antiterminator